MSFENAKENLREFGKELGLEGLNYDENNTCILGIDDEFSMHLTYEPNSDRLYVYSPLIDGLPQDDRTRLKLYETILSGSILGAQMAGGGVGVAVKEGLILLHCVLDMAYAPTTLLRAFAALYVETVEKWRKACRDICEGREPNIEPLRPPDPNQQKRSALPPPSGFSGGKNPPGPGPSIIRG